MAAGKPGNRDLGSHRHGATGGRTRLYTDGVFPTRSGRARFVATDYASPAEEPDVDYPIHRHFLWSKSLELTGGGASPTLAALGRDLAASRPEENA